MSSKVVNLHGNKELGYYDMHGVLADLHETAKIQPNVLVPQQRKIARNKNKQDI